ncbi:MULTISPECIES: CHAP domain-containing protein [unclassified Nonomuraea]|uniref:CHAP domain-containing protein n=1 Tax=unclassified Nonomuraea TaxID=2593643 RepID=UPI0033D461C0
MRKFIDLLEGQLGYSERGGAYTKFGDWYGKNVEFDADYTSAPWCDMMLSWAAHKLGYEEWMGQFAWTVSHAKWFRKHDAWGHKPQPGAFVFYDWSGSRSIDKIDHVGIVTRVEGDTIYTIEGNIDGGVAKRKERDTSKVVGYGYPWRIKERLDREARQNQVDPVLPPANTDTGLLQQTDSTLGALIPYSEVTIVQPPLAARAKPAAKPTNGAQQAAAPTPAPTAQAQAKPQATAPTTGSTVNADKAAKKGKHAKPVTAGTKAVTSEPLSPPPVDAAAPHSSPALEAPALVGSALVAALALLAVAKTRHLRARPALAAPAPVPASPARRRHRRTRRPATAPVAAGATLVTRSTVTAASTLATATARATAGAALAAGATATAGATLVAGSPAHARAALATGATGGARSGATGGHRSGRRSTATAADALLETVEPVAAARSAALTPAAPATPGTGSPSAADFFPADPAATGPLPLHPDILAELFPDRRPEQGAAAPLEPTAIHQSAPLEALGARRIVPVDGTTERHRHRRPTPLTSDADGRLTPMDPAPLDRFAPLDPAAVRRGVSLETVAARLALPFGTFTIPEATSAFDAFGPRPMSAAGARSSTHTSDPVRRHASRPVAYPPQQAEGSRRAEGPATRYAPTEPWPAAEALPQEVAHLVRDARSLLRDAQGLPPREQEPWDAFGRPSHATAHTGDAPQAASAGTAGQTGYAAHTPQARFTDASPFPPGRLDGLQGRPGHPEGAQGRSARQDGSSGGYRGRRRRSGHPVEEPVAFSPDAAPRGRRHRGTAQHRPEQPHHMDARRIDPYWAQPASHRGDGHGGDAHRAGGRWDVRQLEPRWSDQFPQDTPLRGRRHRSPVHTTADGSPEPRRTPPLAAPTPASTGHAQHSVSPATSVSPAPERSSTGTPARDGRRTGSRRGRHRA